MDMTKFYFKYLQHFRDLYVRCPVYVIQNKLRDASGEASGYNFLNRFKNAFRSSKGPIFLQRG